MLVHFSVMAVCSIVKRYVNDTEGGNMFLALSEEISLALS
jgi:hypothetical protein